MSGFDPNEVSDFKNHSVGDLRIAEEYYSSLLKQNTDGCISCTLLWKRGHVYLAMHKFKEARHDLKRAIHKGYRHEDIGSGLNIAALDMYRTGHLDDAIDIYNFMLQIFGVGVFWEEGVKGILKCSLELGDVGRVALFCIELTNSNLFYLLLDVYTFYKKNGDKEFGKIKYRNALKYYLFAEKIQDIYTTHKMSRTGEIQCRIAVALFCQNQHSKALKQLGEAKKYSGNCVQSSFTYWRQRATSKHHEPEESVRAYKIIIFLCNELGIKPEALRKIYYEMIDMLINLKRYDQAVEGMIKAVEVCNSADKNSASHWKRFGNMLYGLDKIETAKVAYAQALELTPNIEIELKSSLHSNLSLMNFKMGSFSAAARNARACIETNRSWEKGYLRLGVAYMGQKNFKDACNEFLHGLKVCKQDATRLELLMALIKSAGYCAETKFTLSASPSEIVVCLRTLCADLDDESYAALKWLFFSSKANMPSRVGAVDLRELIKRDPECQVLEKFLECGANTTENGIHSPWQIALDCNNYRAIVLFIKYDLPGCPFANIDPKEPALHKALAVALHGKLHVLGEALKEFDPSSINTAGNSILHILATGKATDPKLKCLNVLLDSRFTETAIQNKDNKTALEMLEVKDARYSLLTEIEKRASNARSVKQNPSPTKRGKRKKGKGGVKVTASTPKVTGLQRNNSTQKPATVITGSKMSNNCVVQPAVKRGTHSDVIPVRDRVTELVATLDISSRKTADSTSATDSHLQNAGVLEDEIPKCFRRCILTDAERNSGNNGELTSHCNVEGGAAISIDTEDWEIECTAQVIKVLRIANHSLLNNIMGKLEKLAAGKWRGLAVPLSDHRNPLPIRLFETYVSEGVSLLWEEGVAFSERFSEIKFCGKDVFLSSIYDNVIRIWNVVFDRRKLPNMKRDILKSHERGSNCLIPKRLRICLKRGWISDRRTRCRYEEISGRKQILGSTLIEEGDIPVSRTDEDEQEIVTFYPPASSCEKEFHVVKFYSLTSSMCKAACDALADVPIEFPFKVSDLEFSVINLDPKNRCPVLLLGRSGTGKSTCCVYRLWKHFCDYWKEAIHAGPLIPTMSLTDDASDDISDDASEHDENEYLVENSDECMTDEIITDIKDGENEDKVSPEDVYDVCKPNIFPDCTCEGACHCYIFPIKPRQIPVLVISDSNPKEEGPENSKSDEEEEQKQEENQDELAEEAVKPDPYEHLRQIFVTKNPVLCKEVEKTFNDLVHGYPTVSHFRADPSSSLPCSFDKITNEAYPLFLSSRQWLLLLDASLPGDTFFPREKNGDLLVNIPGWTESDNTKTFLHQVDLSEDADNADEYGSDNADSDHAIDKDYRARKPPSGTIAMRGVTYDVFVYTLWPKMKRKFHWNVYHPSLVWTEICSFIKGSIEAMISDDGYLSLDAYNKLGRKYAPNFIGEREKIYILFQHYRKLKIANNMFDETDVLHQLFHRLPKAGCPDWGCHELYVDETQDFTQAELLLFLVCCKNPNAMFLTGDTAQSITRGVSFRFTDVKSLFYSAQKIVSARQGFNNVMIPGGVYQLLHNYRSHSGILNLAASVIDLLTRYFPRSFDHLKRDIGLFPGPKPVLLETKSLGELAVILHGTRRESSTIEFGAHQVILVRDEEAKKNMPEELKCALVLPIFEAKGLEFDDVLLYNFFSSSQANDEWYLVKTYLDHLIDTNQLNLGEFEMDNPLPMCGMAYQDEEELKFNTRPIDFDEKKHKILNTELKQLYTALTRARVNIWIFDEDETKRAPMFEYFLTRNLVEMIKLDSSDYRSYSAKIFADKSTPKDWHEQGQYFYDNGIWSVAETCFIRSGSEIMRKCCSAHLQGVHAYNLAIEVAEQKSGGVAEVYKEYLKAAELYLDCQLVKESIKCLQNAKEWDMVASLYKKLGENVEAGRAFYKADKFFEASKCFEMGRDYRNAVDILYKKGLFEEAAMLMKQYNELRLKGELENAKPPRSTLKLTAVARKAANAYNERGDRESVLRILRNLLNTEEQLDFIGDNKSFLEYRTMLLKKSGRNEEAGKVLMSADHFMEASLVYASIGKEREMLEACLCGSKMIFCKSVEEEEGQISLKTLSNEQRLKNKEVQELLVPSLQRIIECSDKYSDLKAQASFLLALSTQETEDYDVAVNQFEKVRDYFGVFLALFSRRHDDINVFISDRCFASLERILEIVMHLLVQKRRSREQNDVLLACQNGLGWSEVFVENQEFLRLHDRWQFRLICMLLGKKYQASDCYDKSIVAGRHDLAVLLLPAIMKTISVMHKSFVRLYVDQIICPKCLSGFGCDLTCGFRHCPVSEEIFIRSKNQVFKSFRLEGLWRDFQEKVTSSMSSLDSSDPLMSKIKNLIPKDLEKTCKKLFSLVKNYLSLLGIGNVSAKSFQEFIPKDSSIIRDQITHFMQHIRSKVSENILDPDTFFLVQFYSKEIGGMPSHCELILEEHKKIMKSESNFSFNEKAIFIHEKEQVSLYEYFKKSKTELYVKQDVASALYFSTVLFLSKAVSRNKTFPPPDLDFVLGVLEFDMMLCCLIMSKVSCLKKKNVNYLVTSHYMETLRLWDDFFRTEGRNVEHIVSQLTRSNILVTVLKVLKRIVDFLTGTWSPKLHLIKYVASGENKVGRHSDRILLLCLVLLVNSTSPQLQPALSQLVFEIRRYKYLENLSPRVQKAFAGIQQSSDMQYKNVLHELVEQLGDELFFLHWNSQSNSPSYQNCSSSHGDVNGKLIGTKGAISAEGAAALRVGIDDVNSFDPILQSDNKIKFVMRKNDVEKDGSIARNIWSDRAVGEDTGVLDADLQMEGAVQLIKEKNELKKYENIAGNNMSVAPFGVDVYEDVSDPALQEEDDDISFEREENKHYMACEIAARKIQHWFRYQMLKKQSAVEANEENPRELDVTNVYAVDKWVTEKFCSICRISFEKASESTLSIDRDPAIHIKGQIHRENRTKFDNFLLLEENAINPILEKAEELVDRLNLLLEKGIRRPPDDYEINEKIHALKLNVDGIKEKGLWDMSVSSEELGDANYRLERDLDRLERKLKKSMFCRGDENDYIPQPHWKRRQTAFTGRENHLAPRLRKKK